MALNATYRAGGPVTKESIRLFMDAVKSGKKPSEIALVLKDMGFFFKDFIPEYVMGKPVKEALENALILAKESKAGNAYEGIKAYLKEYDLIAQLNNKLSPLQKMKIAKYGVVAPETAKAMGECGAHTSNRLAN